VPLSIHCAGEFIDKKSYKIIFYFQKFTKRFILFKKGKDVINININKYFGGPFRSFSRLNEIYWFKST